MIAVLGLSILLLSSWRLRTTAVGRSFLGFVLVADLWATARISNPYSPGVADLNSLMGDVCGLVIGALVLRLASQVANDSARLPWSTEATIWLPTAIVIASGNELVAALWVTVVFASASIRFNRVSLRSWDGYRAARTAIIAMTFLPSVLPVMVLFGVPDVLPRLLGPLMMLGLSVVLFYGLPRLGLLAQGTVHHGTVIEAMSDGVLVVDMDGRLVDFNQSARDILELEVDAWALEKLTKALAHHPDLVELFSGAIEGRSVYTPEPRRAAGRGSGEPEVGRTFDLQLSPLWDAAGSVQSRVLVLRDITDRIEIEEENRRQALFVRLVHQVSATVHEARTIESGLEAALALIGKTMQFGLGHFLRSSEAQEDRGQLVASGIVYCGVRLDDLDHGHGPRPSVSSPGPSQANRGYAAVHGVEAVNAGRSTIPNGMLEFDRRGVSWWKELGFRSVLTMPILIGPRLYGVFEFFAADDVSFDESTNEIFEHVGELVGRAVERKLADERIRRLAYHDDLTGLPNRQRFQQLLRGAVSLASRSDRQMALLFLDLDGFKKVNDTLGHEVGDKLLAEVATRFSRVVRISDHVGRQESDAPESAISRLGGDEFTVLLTEISDPSGAALVADRLLATLEAPVILAGQELFMSTSIGIAVYPDDGTDAESLLRNSDAAMYFAKGRGRNGYSFYSEEMNQSRSQRIEIESRLRGALERDAFEVHYQPILNVETGRIVAAEALVRWEDPELGCVPPDLFIPVAEETGLVVSLGQWVFRKACEQARGWRDELGTPIRIGVNVSGHQIREPGMVQMVREALEATGVAPEQVELEITESTIMQDDALTVQTLGDLKSMGVRLALDDFGTGYSSLSYLRRFTIDRVKIDRTFVSELPENVGDAALTSAIIAMAHGLDLEVVAEGVETPRQALFLKQRGCDELQGYLFGHPCPAHEFAELLRATPLSIEDRKEEDAAI